MSLDTDQGSLPSWILFPFVQFWFLIFRIFIPTVLLYSQRYKINAVKTQPFSSELFSLIQYFKKLQMYTLSIFKNIYSILFIHLYILFYTIYYYLYIFHIRRYDWRWDLNPNTMCIYFFSFLWPAWWWVCSVETCSWSAN